MEFTPWTILVDAGLIGLLLIIGAGLRAVIRPIQNLMIPASVIAGILGLILGPQVLGWFPFSEQLSTYSSILIAVVFAAVAMTDDFDVRKLNRNVGGFAAHGVLMYSLQVALGMAIVLMVLQPLFDAPDAMGVLLFAGWAGGYGTAAAMGDAFADTYPELASLAFTSATVGIILGIVGGLILARIGASRGHVAGVSSVSKMPEEERTGLIRQVNKRPSIGQHTFTGSSIESLGFQVSLVVMIAAVAYGLSLVVEYFWPDLAVPVFVLAFLTGLVVRAAMSRGRVATYVDKPTLQSISGTATDVLIVAGIASIQPSVVADFGIELLLMFAFGLAVMLILSLWVAPRLMTTGWFERSLFTWGWSTGAVATGIAMLRVVDPELKSGTLEDFGLAYIPVTPVEITAVTFVPPLVIAGAAWAVVGIWGAIAVVAVIVGLFIARANKRDAASVGT
jgi:ESS family glutamate:Na+ symporter